VGAGVVALWIAFGAAPWDVVRYLAYEAAFVAVPGIVALRALAPRLRDGLTTVAVGWALGYAIGLLAFALSGALEARGLFPVYPLVVLAAAAPVAWRRRVPGEDSGRLPPGAAWAIAVVALLAALYVAGGYFTLSPEPGGSRTVAYYPDFAFHISIAAEAKHHWPVGEPSVGGRGFHYHTFVHMHLAAVSDVTGIELTALVFRFLPLTLIVLATLQLAALGRRLGGAAVAGATAALALCAGELDLDPERFAPFAGNLLRGLFLSPSMLLGLTLLLPIVVLAVARLREGTAGSAGEAGVLALLLVAAAGAKAAALPVLIAGFAFAVAWCALVERRLDRGAVRLLGLSLAVFAATYVLLYSGGGEGGLEPGLFAVFDATVVAETLRAPGDGLGGALLWLPGAPAVLALLCLPLAGAAWSVARRGRALGAARASLAGMFLAGLGAALVLRHPAGAQLYFLFYGYLAALPLAAEGFVALWTRVAARLPDPARTLGAAGGGVLVTGLAASELVRALDLRTAASYALMYGALAVAVALATALVSRAAGGLTRRPMAGLAVGLLVLATALDAPIDWLRAPAARAVQGDSLYTAAKTERVHGLDPELFEGLRWIRAHTDEDAVLAVNNHWADTAGTHSVFAYYSAFAERRVYLESWLYARESLELGYGRVKGGTVPFPDRLALNDGAFRRADLLPRLREEGVTHLVVDRLNGPPAPAAGALGEPAYSNGSIAVYELR
jgi:hypothetical protein